LFHQETYPNEPAIAIRISSWEGLYAQVADMTLMLSQASAMLSDVVHLEIKSEGPREDREDDRRDDIRWLELLHPFVAVKTLRISSGFAEDIANAFEEMPAEVATHVLPVLKSLHFEGPYKRTTERLSNIFRGCGRTVIITETHAGLRRAACVAQT
jgi:hypothetical protein